MLTDRAYPLNLDLVITESDNNLLLCSKYAFTARHLWELIEAHTLYHEKYSKEKIKTLTVALVICLNIDIDPPDVQKIPPFNRSEAWFDPTDTNSLRALGTIGKNLQSQYERWQPRARYKQCLDPTLDDVKKLCCSLRRNAKEDRILFHYNGHGVPRPTEKGEIWVFNTKFTKYIPLSLYDLQRWLGAPSVYVIDCNNAGRVIRMYESFCLRRMANQHNAAGSTGNASFHPPADGLPVDGRDLPCGAPPQEVRGESGPAVVTIDSSNVGARVAQPTISGGMPGSGGHSSPAPPLVSMENTIMLAACREEEFLPQNPDLPADLFTACLTTPIRMALRWHWLRYQEYFPGYLEESLLDRIPGSNSNRMSLLGEVNWIFTAVTDTIAWCSFPVDLFQKLFRQDLLVASLFRNFLLAERIMKCYGCQPVSAPALSPTYQHSMWDAWDHALDRVVHYLPGILASIEGSPNPERKLLPIVMSSSGAVASSCSQLNTAAVTAGGEAILLQTARTSALGLRTATGQARQQPQPTIASTIADVVPTGLATVATRSRHNLPAGIEPKGLPQQPRHALIQGAGQAHRAPAVGATVNATATTTHGPLSQVAGLVCASRRYPSPPPAPMLLQQHGYPRAIAVGQPPVATGLPQVTNLANVKVHYTANPGVGRAEQPGLAGAGPPTCCRQRPRQPKPGGEGNANLLDGPPGFAGPTVAGKQANVVDFKAVAVPDQEPTVTDAARTGDSNATTAVAYPTNAGATPLRQAAPKAEAVSAVAKADNVDGESRRTLKQQQPSSPVYPGAGDEEEEDEDDVDDDDDNDDDVDVDESDSCDLDGDDEEIEDDDDDLEDDDDEEEEEEEDYNGEQEGGYVINNAVGRVCSTSLTDTAGPRRRHPAAFFDSGAKTVRARFSCPDLRRSAPAPLHHQQPGPEARGKTVRHNCRQTRPPAPPPPPPVGYAAVNQPEADGPAEGACVAVVGDAKTAGAGAGAASRAVPATVREPAVPPGEHLGRPEDGKTSVAALERQHHDVKPSVHFAQAEPRKQQQPSVQPQLPGAAEQAAAVVACVQPGGERQLQPQAPPQQQQLRRQINVRQQLHALVSEQRPAGATIATEASGGLRVPARPPLVSQPLPPAACPHEGQYPRPLPQLVVGLPSGHQQQQQAAPAGPPPVGGAPLHCPAVTTCATVVAPTLANTTSAAGSGSVIGGSGPASFFTSQMTDFKIWLQTADESRPPATQLPILLQILLSQSHRIRAMQLLSEFLDLGPWAVTHCLTVGILPYIVRLFHSPVPEVKPYLVFIWGKIIASAQTEFGRQDSVRDSGYKYFITCLSDTENLSPLTRTVTAFALAKMLEKEPDGQPDEYFQEVYLRQNFIPLVLTLLYENPPDLQLDSHVRLRLWLVFTLAKLWCNNDEARWYAVRYNVTDVLFAYLDDVSPEVRAATVYALGTLIDNDVRDASKQDHADQISHQVGARFARLAGLEASPLVRAELVAASAGLVRQFEAQLSAIAMQYMRKLNVPATTVATRRLSSLSLASHSQKLSPMAPVEGAVPVTPASTLGKLGSGNIYDQIWRTLIHLANDPCPRVSSLVESLVAYVLQKSGWKAGGETLPPPIGANGGRVELLRCHAATTQADENDAEQATPITTRAASSLSPPRSPFSFFLPKVGQQSPAVAVSAARRVEETPRLQTRFFVYTSPGTTPSPVRPVQRHRLSQADAPGSQLGVAVLGTPVVVDQPDSDACLIHSAQFTSRRYQQVDRRVPLLRQSSTGANHPPPVAMAVGKSHSSASGALHSHGTRPAEESRQPGNSTYLSSNSPAASLSPAGQEPESSGGPCLPRVETHFFAWSCHWFTQPLLRRCVNDIVTGEASASLGSHHRHKDAFDLVPHQFIAANEAACRSTSKVVDPGSDKTSDFNTVHVDAEMAAYTERRFCLQRRREILSAGRFRWLEATGAGGLRHRPPSEAVGHPGHLVAMASLQLPQPWLPECLAFHPFQDHLAVAIQSVDSPAESAVHIYSSQTLQPVNQIPSLASKPNLVNPAIAVRQNRIFDLQFINASEEDGGLLLVVHSDGRLRIWRDYSGKEARILTSWTALNDVSATGATVISWCQSAGQLAVSGDVKSIRLWDCNQEARLRDLPTGTDCPAVGGGGVTRMTRTADARLLAAGFANGSVRVYDLRSPCVADWGHVYHNQLECGGVRALRFTENNSASGAGGQLYAVGSNGGLATWQLAAGDVTRTRSLNVAQSQQVAQRQSSATGGVAGSRWPVCMAGGGSALATTTTTAAAAAGGPVVRLVRNTALPNRLNRLASATAGSNGTGSTSAGYRVQCASLKVDIASAASRLVIAGVDTGATGGHLILHKLIDGSLHSSLRFSPASCPISLTVHPIDTMIAVGLKDRGLRLLEVQAKP